MRPINRRFLCCFLVLVSTGFGRTQRGCPSKRGRYASAYWLHLKFVSVGTYLIKYLKSYGFLFPLIHIATGSITGNKWHFCHNVGSVGTHTKKNRSKAKKVTNLPSTESFPLIERQAKTIFKVRENVRKLLSTVESNLQLTSGWLGKTCRSRARDLHTSEQQSLPNEISLEEVTIYIIDGNIRVITFFISFVNFQSLSVMALQPKKELVIIKIGGAVLTFKVIASPHLLFISRTNSKLSIWIYCIG